MTLTSALALKVGDTVKYLPSPNIILAATLAQLVLPTDTMMLVNYQQPGGIVTKDFFNFGDFST